MDLQIFVPLGMVYPNNASKQEPGPGLSTKPTIWQSPTSPCHRSSWCPFRWKFFTKTHGALPLSISMRRGGNVWQGIAFRSWFSLLMKITLTLSPQAVEYVKSCVFLEFFPIMTFVLFSIFSFCWLVSQAKFLGRVSTSWWSAQSYVGCDWPLVLLHFVRTLQ